MSYKHNEDKKQYARKYYLAHKSEILQHVRAYRKANYTQLQKKWRARYYKNRSANIQKSRNWYRKNRKRVLTYQHIRRQTKEYKAYHKKYARNWARKRREKDPSFVIMGRLRCRINAALRSKGAIKSEATECLIGCSVKEFLAHLEKLFKPGMTWQNRQLWHIDHIKPIVSFDLNDPLQQQKCFNFTNLQPLWKADNLSKGSRW